MLKDSDILTNWPDQFLTFTRSSQQNIELGSRSMSEDSFRSEDFKRMASPPPPPPKGPVRKRKPNAKALSRQAVSSQRSAPPPPTAPLEHVDLTKSDDDEDNDSSEQGDHQSHSVHAATTATSYHETDTDAEGAPTQLNTTAEAPEQHPSNSNGGIASALDVTPLPSHHETKYLGQARLQFASQRPPFVRLNRNGGPRTVMLTIGDGQLPETAVLANLATQQWDSSYSFYTLDRNGERLIVKSFGYKAKRGVSATNPFRTWSGQGNIFEDVPIAFAFKGNAEQQASHQEDLGDDLDSNFEDISIQGSDSFRDDDYLSTVSEGYQGPTTRSALRGNPANQGRLAHVTTNGDDGPNRRPKEALASGHGSVPGVRIRSLRPSPSESLRATPKISDVAAGKRPARDAIDEDHLLKKAYSVSATTAADNSITARIPSTLTAHKQEHTVLYVMLPGPTSVMVPVKLRSAMSMSALFSSVSAAAGVQDYENMAIVVKLGGENGSIMVKQEMMETFEVFLEIIDQARCWGEETGSLSLGVQLRWRYLCEMDAQM